MIKFLLLGILLNIFTAQAASVQLMTGENGQQIIAFDGPLEEGDEFLVLSAIIESNYNVKYIGLNSGGGLVTVGTKIERIIRDHNLTAVVPDGAVCLSACANLWLAAKQKFMSRGAKIGFHVAYYPEPTLFEILGRDGMDGLQQRIQIVYSSSLDNYVFLYGALLHKPYEFAFNVSTKGYSRGHFWYPTVDEMVEHVKRVRIY